MKIISFEEFAEKLKIKPVNVNELKPTDDKSDGLYNGVVFSNIDIDPYFYKAGSSMLFEEGCVPVTMNASYNEKEFDVSMVILDEPVIVDPSTGIKYTNVYEFPKSLKQWLEDGKLNDGKYKVEKDNELMIRIECDVFNGLLGIKTIHNAPKDFINEEKICEFVSECIVKYDKANGYWAE